MEKKAPKKRSYNCLLCSFQEVCSEAEFTKHIRQQHEELYTPREKKPKQRR